MYSIRVKRKKQHLFRNLAIVLFVVVVSFTIFICTDDSSTYLLLLQRKYAQIKDEQSYHIALPEESTGLVEGGMTSATTGEGLNLMLISKLNESYIKELLSIYQANEEGKLGDAKHHISVSALLGIGVNETGTYDGYLPKTYLPYENGKVLWNTTYKGLSANQMTLMEFGDTEWNSAIGGLCSWLSEDKADKTQFQIQQTVPHASKFNKTGKADQHYLPDIVNYVDEKFNDALKQWGLADEELPAGLAESFSSMTHNRGSTGMSQQCFGLSYSLGSSTYFSSHIDIDKASKEDKLNAYGALASLINGYKENNMKGADLTGILDSSYGRYVAIAIACHTDGWFFSDMTENYVSRYSTAALTAWKALYPEENMTKEKMLSQIRAKTMSLADAIKEVTGTTVSTSDTKNVYNTSNNYDDGKYTSGGGYPTMFRVTKDRCKAYKNKYSDGNTPFLANAFDIICAGHSAHAVLLGDFIYGTLLKLGGLDVDPTNPDDYKNKITNGGTNDTWVPSGDTSWYAETGVDTSKLNEKRSKVLAAAYDLQGIPYHQCRGSVCVNKHDFTCDGHCYNDKGRPTHLDCSSFVWRAYKDALGSIPSSFPTSTGAYPTSSCMETISFDELKPGDLVCKPGVHVEIYLGEKNGKVYTIGSHAHGVLSGIGRGYSGSSGLKKTFSYAYRFKGIDD